MINKINNISTLNYSPLSQNVNNDLNRLMKALPGNFKKELQHTLKSMDEHQRKNVISQLKQLDVNNLSQNQLLKEVQNILNPTTSAYNFSVYA